MAIEIVTLRLGIVQTNCYIVGDTASGAAVVIDPGPYDVARWPRLYDARRSWYCKTEARTRLMISPAVWLSLTMPSGYSST